MDSNGHAERIGRLLLNGWPKDAAAAKTLKAAVESEIEAEAEAKRLAEVRKLGAELKYQTKWERIAAIVERLKELCR